MRPSHTETLIDWNVVVTLPENTYREATRMLAHWGKVGRTSFNNVLTMRVSDPRAFLVDFAVAIAVLPGLLNLVSHVVPAQRTFSFESTEEFEGEARAIALSWLPDLARSSFYVRLHRRGFKGILSTRPEERFLDAALLAALSETGRPGQISFEDPDKVIQIETVDGGAGMSLWTREGLRRFPFCVD